MSIFNLEALLDAIRMQESRGDPNAVSPAGAKGPYQIMPFNTAEAIGNSGKLPIGGAEPIPAGMLTDENRSRQFAREAITGLLKQYNGDVSKALAAYNAGPSNIDKGRYPMETQAYVPSVLNRYDHAVSANANVPTPTPERARFDSIVAQKKGIAQPMSMGSAPDMVAEGLAAENMPAFSENNTIGTDFLRGGTGQESDLGLRPEPKSGVTVEEEPTSSNEDLRMQADAGGGGNFLSRLFPGDESTKDMGFFERMRQPGNRQAMFRMGAGLAGNASKGWGAGIGAGFEGAADALDRQEALDVTKRRTDLAELGPKAAFASLYQFYKGKGDPDALNKAMIGAYAPESGKFMGMTDERTEAMKNADYFGKMDPKDPGYAFAPTKAARMTVAEKKEIFDAEDDLPNLAATQDTLKRAAELNGKTFEGAGAGIRTYLGSKLKDGLVPDFVADPQTAKNTNEWQNLMGGEAIKTMANTLKGATTDFELGKFVEMLADPETPIDTRARIIERMQQLAIKKNRMIRERVNELRGGEFFRPGGGTSNEPEVEDPFGVR